MRLKGMVPVSAKVKIDAKNGLQKLERGIEEQICIEELKMRKMDGQL